MNMRLNKKIGLNISANASLTDIKEKYPSVELQDSTKLSRSKNPKKYSSVLAPKE